MTAPASKLLQPITVGPLELKTRIMFPPLTTGYEERDGSIGERSLAFYERLARGGVSYIVIGDVAPVMTASPTPKLATDAQIPTFKALADAVHKHGAKVALQLFHPEYDVPGVGRMVMGSMAAAKAAQEAKAAGDEETFAAKMAESNEIRNQAYAKLHHDMQHFVNEASVEQLTQIKEAIAASAARAQQAGIDAIEVHGDRLVGSLCSAILNQRTDEYGGSFENRVRYALEVVAAIKEAAPQLMVEYKLPVIMENPDGTPRGKGGLQPDEACEFAKLLEGAGIDMIQVAQANHTGNMGDTIPPMGAMPYNWTLPVAERVKALVSVPVATVGRVVSVEAGEKILEDGAADIIAYGRSLMCDPDIALKAATGEPIRECLNCNKGCVDAIQNRKYISCVLNAENGDEATIAIKPGEGDKKIAVVGGGIAGLEAARVAAKRGYDVTVYEASDHLGGQIVLAAAPPRKDEIMRSVEYYEKILPGLGVKVELRDCGCGRTRRGHSRSGRRFGQGRLELGRAGRQGGAYGPRRRHWRWPGGHRDCRVPAAARLRGGDRGDARQDCRGRVRDHSAADHERLCRAQRGAAREDPPDRHYRRGRGGCSHHRGRRRGAGKNRLRLRGDGRGLQGQRV